MNKYLKLLSLAFLATSALTFTACSDDDDDNNGPGNAGEPTIDNVFSQGLPASFDGATFTTNANGQVTEISDQYSKVTFEYGTFSRATTFNVLMKVRDSYDTTDGSDIYMQLNKQGFVTYALQIYTDPEDDNDEWRFEYNSDGQMTRMQRTESGDDFKMNYSNGDITKVYKDDKDGDHREYTFVYTNTANPSAVANKGCIMLFDDAFHIDMDEMEIAYYAGLLGKATKNLPMGYTRAGIEGGDKYTDDPETFGWDFNADKLPVKFWTVGEEYDAVTFSWK